MHVNNNQNHNTVTNTPSSDINPIPIFGGLLGLITFANLSKEDNNSHLRNVARDNFNRVRNQDNKETLDELNELANEIIEEYFHNLEPVFKIIKECEEGRDVSSILNGEVALSTFQRLNLSCCFKIIKNVLNIHDKQN